MSGAAAAGGAAGTARPAGADLFARVLPWAVGAVAGALALGPALGPGFVLSYDMVAVPDPPLSAVTLGGGGGFPRAVPSDAVLGALGLLLPGDLAQALLLMAVFTLAGAGAGRLVPVGTAGGAGGAGAAAVAARAAAAVFYVWNPFIAERLLLGQWAMLLGYAGLPWAVAAAGRLATARAPGRRDFAGLVAALLPAAAGGFSAMVLSALAGLPAAVLGARGLRRALAAGGAVAAAIALLSLPWLVPALGSGARTDPSAVGLFAARADTPFGVIGSLLSLGGVWNANAVPEWFGVPGLAACRLTLSLAAVAGWVWLLRRGGAAGFGAGLSAAAATGLAIALAGATGPGRDVLEALISLWPGFGPLRDGQLYVAPLALLESAGMAGAVLWVKAAAAPEEPRMPARPGAEPEGAEGAARPAAGADADRGANGDGRSEAGGRGGPRDSSRADPAFALPLRSGGRWRTRPQRRPLSMTPPPRPAGAPAPARVPCRSGHRAAALLGAVLALAPVALLPGLAWGAAGRLDAVAYPGEWHRVQHLVDADPRPGRVLVLPWSAYRGLDWSADGRRVVVLDPATKLFERQTVFNDDLRVRARGEVRVADGEDPLARQVERLHAVDPAAPRYIEALGDLGVRYILVERAAAERLRGSGAEAALGPLAGHVADNRFSSTSGGAAAAHEGARLLLIEIPDQHVTPVDDGLAVLEASAWFVTVGAIIWSLAVSGSSLGSRRTGPPPGAVSRKENPT